MGFVARVVYVWFPNGQMISRKGYAHVTPHLIRNFGSQAVINFLKFFLFKNILK
jgi:hypothetical protein